METLVVKYRKDNLTVVDGAFYGGSGIDSITSVDVDDTYLVAVGITYSEGIGTYSGLIIKYYKENLTIASKKIYTDAGHVAFYGVRIDGNDLYAAGTVFVSGVSTEALLVTGARLRRALRHRSMNQIDHAVRRGNSC